jgi:hypothetical protein
VGDLIKLYTPAPHGPRPLHPFPEVSRRDSQHVLAPNQPHLHLEKDRKHSQPVETQTASRRPLAMIPDIFDYYSHDMGSSATS